LSINQKKITRVSLPSWLWKTLQVLLWLVAILLVSLLIFKPDLGIILFWNLLIPIAPLLIVLIPGIWRNICPLSSTALLPRKLGWSKKHSLSVKQSGRLFLLGVMALLLIVPLRHLLLNTSGLATAVMLLIAAGVAVFMGIKYEWRSGWCASLCPIHSVERLYGSTPAFTTDNSHCSSCEKCTSLCPDSTSQMTASLTRNVATEKFAGIIMTGGFVGYIWGWYHVPDYQIVGLGQILNAYLWPFGSGIITLSLYLYLRKRRLKKQISLLNQGFATAAVICYYWYRIPSLLGIGLYPTDGVLIDLSSQLPIWFPLLTKGLTAIFFIWFMLLRPRNRAKQSWNIRPEYSVKVTN